MTQRDGFARYLEISGSRDAQDLFVAEFGASALQDLRRRWSGAIVGIEVTRVKVETELGPSDRATNDSLSYCFPTKPGYLYTFRFREDGLWRWSGVDSCVPNTRRRSRTHRIGPSSCTEWCHWAPRKMSAVSFLVSHSRPLVGGQWKGWNTRSVASNFGMGLRKADPEGVSVQRTAS